MPLTHRQLTVSIRAAMAAWQWNADDVLVHALPLYHQHGLGGVHAALIAGGTVHIRSKFSAADLVQAAGDTRATVLFAVPTIYQALAECPAALAGGLRGLRLAICGSAPLSPALAARLPAVLGRLPLVRYGTTESGLDVSNPIADPRGDTIGVPLPGVLPGYGPRTAWRIPARTAWRIPARTARSSSAGRTSSRATGTTRSPPRPPSPRTAGSAPATSGPWTRSPGTWRSAAGPRR